MKLIRQDGEFDCGAACIAMALDMVRAKDAYPFLGYNPDEVTPKGVGSDEVIAIMRSTGRDVYSLNSLESVADSWGVPPAMLRERNGLTSESYLRQMLGAMQTGCAIVSVPSLNIVGEGHFVFCCKGEAYDPSNKKRYIGNAQSLPVTSVIFIKERS